MTRYISENLRNIVLLSHPGAGKTAIGEAMLFTSGATTRLGRVEDGNTVSDYEPEEIKRNSSIQTSLLPLEWNGTKLNVLDAPGYADFAGETASAMRVADAAVLVISAPSGVEVGTEQMWRRIQETSLPCIIFINQMDKDRADFQETLGSLRERLGTHCIALAVPIGSEREFKGVVNVMDGGDVPAEAQETATSAHERLIEAVAETNDELATLYLEGNALDPEKIQHGLKEAIISGSIVPVLVGSATQPSGIRELMDAIVKFLPSPVELPPIKATLASSENSEKKITCNVDGPPAALVFKTTADPFVGKLSYFRVYSGTFKSNTEVWNGTKGQAERIGHVYVPCGKSQEQVPELVTGEIGSVSKLGVTVTGDTLGTRENPVILPGITFPSPVYSVAVHPKSKADVDKMSTALSRLGEEDPSLQVGRDAGTGEVVLSGLGDAHVDTVADKAKRKFGVDLELSPPRVAYRETITATTKVEYKHKKQSGGHGQYGHVLLELEPLSHGEGFEFKTRVVGGSVPREYIPAVEKGVSKSLNEGPLMGYPVVDLRVTLYDGSFHPVDSSGMSFEIAGGFALRKGIQQGQPVLLEPIMKMYVNVPDAFTGDVMGDLNSRRAKIQGTIPEDGVTAIEAEVPQAEVLRYASDLRSLSQGRGTFEVKFAYYDVVPQHIAQKIVEESKATEGTKA